MKLLLAVLIVAPLSVFCQKGDSTKVRKIVLGINFSPDYCYRVLKPEASVQFIADRRDSMEIPKYGFTTGLNLLFGMHNKFVFEAGLQFSDKGEQTKKYDLIWAQPDPGLPIKISTVYHYRYIDIPLKADYFFARGRRISFRFMKKIMRGKVPASDLGFFISGGISTNIFLSEKAASEFEYSDGHTATSESTDNGLARVNLAAIGGLGMSFNIAQRINIRIEPVYRRSIIPIINAPIHQYSYSVGVNAGIYFSFQ